MKKRNNRKRSSESNFSKLSVFQNQKYKFKKNDEKDKDNFSK